MTSDADDDLTDKTDSTRLRRLLGSVIRDVYQDDEQTEILRLSQQSFCELGFEKVTELNCVDYVSKNRARNIMPHNSRKCGPMLIILSLSHSQMKCR